MLKTLVIEDETYIRKGLIAKINSLDKELTIIGESGSVKEAVILVKACHPDLIFLDINLLDGNAFDFLDQIEELSFKIIFTTSYEEYALKALKKGAVDFLLKPVEEDELTIAINKVISSTSNINEEQIRNVHEEYNAQQGKLILRLQDSFQVIELKELLYCKSDKGYTTFYLSNGKNYMASKPLKDFESQLPEEIFVRTHQSYFVNINHIDNYNKKELVVLKDGQEIPVSIRKKESFLTKFFGGTN